VRVVRGGGEGGAEGGGVLPGGAVALSIVSVEYEALLSVAYMFGAPKHDHALQ
jgi:hypothetical protein